MFHPSPTVNTFSIALGLCEWMLVLLLCDLPLKTGLWHSLGKCVVPWHTLGSLICVRVFGGLNLLWDILLSWSPLSTSIKRYLSINGTMCSNITIWCNKISTHPHLSLHVCVYMWPSCYRRQWSETRRDWPAGQMLRLALVCVCVCPYIALHVWSSGWTDVWCWLAAHAAAHLQKIPYNVLDL